MLIFFIECVCVCSRSTHGASHDDSVFGNIKSTIDDLVNNQISDKLEVRKNWTNKNIKRRIERGKARLQGWISKSAAPKRSNIS